MTWNPGYGYNNDVLSLDWCDNEPPPLGMTAMVVVTSAQLAMAQNKKRIEIRVCGCIVASGDAAVFARLQVKP